jgi:hypothetical protein
MYEGRWFMALLLAGGLSACTPGEDDTAETGAATESREDQAEQAQANFNRTAKSRIDALQERADQLDERVGQAPEKVREDLEAQLADWKQKADDLEGRIDNFEATSPEQWREFESRATAEMSEIEQSLNELAKRVETTPADR